VDELHTEIPELRKWCKDLTVKSRRHTSKLFYESIGTFINSILPHIEGLERATYQAEHAELSRQWQTPSQAFGLRKNDIEAIQVSDRSEHMLDSSMGDSNSKCDLVGIYPRLCNEFTVLEDEFVRDLRRRMRGCLNRACDKGATLVGIRPPVLIPVSLQAYRQRNLHSRLVTVSLRRRLGTPIVQVSDNVNIHPKMRVSTYSSNCPSRSVSPGPK